MPFIVTRSAGPPAIISVQAVFDMVDPETNICELAAGIKRREQVPVTFRDGSAGVVCSIDTPMREDVTGQTALALISPGRRFVIECKLIVGVPMLVSCNGRNPAHAQTVLNEVFQGARPIEPGFAIEVNRDDLHGLFADLDAALASADLSRLEPSHVTIDRIHETYPGTPHATVIDLSATQAG